MANTNNPTQKTVQEMGNNSYDSTFNQNAVEVLGYDPTTNGLRRLNVDPAGNLVSPGYVTEMDYNGGANLTYLGVAVPNTATSDASWQIKKLSYDSSSNLTSIQFAGGTQSFNQIWDNRASLSYS